MNAFVTSIGEPTKDLCIWSLKRNGFDVHLIENNDSLSSKLLDIYASANDDFLRVDADVIPNQNLNPDNVRDSSGPNDWWVQFLCFDWFKQDIGYGGIQYIKQEALVHLRNNIADALILERPETYLSRIKEFYNPRRFVSSAKVMGLHNYRNDMNRVRNTKIRRKQSDNYDFELAEKLGKL